MYIADLHIHSRYSRATSRDCTPEYLDLWARKKGIHIVGSGDFTHPAWREELKEKLEPAEDGFYTLKKEYRIADETAPDSFLPRFAITGEISSIYKKNGRVRKVHSLIVLPDLEAAEIVSKKLELIGNIHSDGRPILGLSCHDLLEILLELSQKSIYVPAHIWTPHFSLFGAFSGFDTVEECFEDLSPHIHAMETGLSSDPPMNWRISALDRYQLISNSDAHSPAKLGREANLLDIDLCYEGLRQAIEMGKGLCGTIEFFPEEGKYHLDGHRKCKVCLTPQETEAYNGICPVCGRKITVGVSHRVEQLADREEGYIRKEAKRFESLVPLPEVIAASVGHSPESGSVQKEYRAMLQKLGAEFEILRTVPIEEIRSVSGYLISEGIGRLREGKVERIPGFDGEYGTIQLFRPDELSGAEGQMDFFDMIGIDIAETGKKKNTARKESLKPGAREKETAPAGEQKEQTKEKKKVLKGTEDSGTEGRKEELNKRQEEAVCAAERRIAVIAGPGTGKTKTLIAHLVYLLEERKAKPSEITAVTFTNHAAAEMRERLQKWLGGKRKLRGLQIGTFHAVCLEFLRRQGLEFDILEEADAAERAQNVIERLQLRIKPAKFLEQLSLKKSGAPTEEDAALAEAFAQYQRELESDRLMDFDDLLLQTEKRMECSEENRQLQEERTHFSYLLIDEFQDINPLQYRLAKKWNERGKELFVIGDPDQSIYGFRGADSRCFDRLQTDYEDTRVISLAENYRSSPEILRAALEVISRNPGAERKLHANAQSNARVRMIQAGSEMGEAIFIAKEINRLAGGIGMLEAHEAAENMQQRKVRGFDEIAVLYRTHRQGELLERCLRQEGIPYVVAGRESFLQDQTVRGSICFFRYLDHPDDHLRKKQAGKLLWSLEENEVSDAILEQTAEKWRPLYQKKKPQKFLELWMEEMQLSGHAAIQKLAGMTVFYKTMAEFLNALILGVESDLKRCAGRSYTAEAVTLMTLHGAKGLEFPAAFLYGARKGSIPLESEKHPSDAEEERRLLYVGMTRAKEELILTSSGEESEFLSDLSEDILHREKADKKKKQETCHQMSLFEL